jgi:endonuclease YncB( thermonuclease family)
MFLPLKTAALPQHGGLALAAGAIFAAGLALGAVIGPGMLGRALTVQTVPARTPAAPVTLRASYPAEVLRVLDGDTFEARVKVWPGMEAVTRVRLRGIDAPEMKARCEDERVKALAAHDALARMLGEGAVGITNVGQDKYGGRVDADATTANTPNVADAMVAQGFARRYDGGKRISWCG